jgi:hypothetical protein
VLPVLVGRPQAAGLQPLVEWDVQRETESHVDELQARTALRACTRTIHSARTRASMIRACARLPPGEGRQGP